MSAERNRSRSRFEAGTSTGRCENTTREDHLWKTVNFLVALLTTATGIVLPIAMGHRAPPATTGTEPSEGLPQLRPITTAGPAFNAIRINCPRGGVLTLRLPREVEQGRPFTVEASVAIPSVNAKSAPVATPAPGQVNKVLTRNAATCVLMMADLRGDGFSVEGPTAAEQKVIVAEGFEGFWVSRVTSTRFGDRRVTIGRKLSLRWKLTRGHYGSTGSRSRLL